MSVFWIPVISIAGGIAMIIVMSLAATRTRQHQAELKANVQMKLIERFGSADDFLKFVRTDEGKQFLGDAPKIAKRGMVGGVRVGIIMTSIGLAFVGLAFINDRDWFVPAFILLGLGLGFFISALVSMRMAKKLEDQGEDLTV